MKLSSFRCASMTGRSSPRRRCGRVAASVIAMVGCSSLAMAQSQFLMVVDSGSTTGSDRVVLLDPTNGQQAPGGDNFITASIPGGPYTFQTPIEAIQVGNEIWVTDQLADRIFRFAAAVPTNYIGEITGQLDNIRGGCVLGDRVYIANQGSANGAPGPAIAIFDFQGARVGNLLLPAGFSPFDVEPFEGDLLVSDSQGDSISRYSTTGALVNVVHQSAGGPDGINFPQQIHVAPSGPSGAAELWVGGFSPPGGTFRFTTSGTQLARYAVLPGTRGAFWLPTTGEAMASDGQVALAFSIPDLVQRGLVAGSMRFFSRLSIPPAPPTCNDIDFNNDGIEQDPTDIEAFLSVYSGGQCLPTGSVCDTIDFNNDGIEQDPTDIEAFLSVYSGGPCF